MTTRLGARRRVYLGPPAQPGKGCGRHVYSSPRHAKTVLRTAGFRVGTY